MRLPVNFTRRDWLALLLMGVGLVLSYGTFAIQGLLFILPERVRPRTRKLFAGQLDQFKVGSVQSFFDLQGNKILVKRSESEIQAFSSTCPHLGCHVHWEVEKKRFFCPCHNGVFNADGVAVSGPPAAAGQSLSRLPLELDKESGVIYLEVKDIKRKRT